MEKKQKTLTFGEKVEDLRKSSGMTQTDLAKVLGVHRTSVVAYEQSTAQPKYEILKTMADFFHVTTDYLIGVAEIEETSLFAENAFFY